MAKHNQKLTPEILQKALERLAEGRSLRSICKDEDIPVTSTAIRLHALKDPQFASQYAEARDLGLDEMAEEMFEIADDGSNDWMEKNSKDGGTYMVVNHEHVTRSKLRKETRQWYLSKLAPKRYGDKLQQEISNPDGSLRGLGRDQIAHKLNAILDAAKRRAEANQAQQKDDLDALVEELV
jgi:hypothetical protein